MNGSSAADAAGKLRGTGNERPIGLLRTIDENRLRW
jgi:hypothetical protein